MLLVCLNAWTSLSAIFLWLFQGINCLHNELVMEVMWGMKHLMHKLVPGEKSQLSMEDRLPMSQGLQILLRRYGLMSNQRWWVHQLPYFFIAPCRLVFNFTIACVLTKILHFHGPKLFMQFFLEKFAFLFIFLWWCNARCIQVNEQIVATARVLFKCDDVEKKEYQNLCLIRHYLKKVPPCLALTMRVGTLSNLQQHLRSSYQEV